MSDWRVNLKGGPFHGDSCTIDYLPPHVYVMPCPRNDPACGTHWYANPPGEPYSLDEVTTEQTATYVHGQNDLPGERKDTDERVPVKTGAPAPGELIPA